MIVLSKPEVHGWEAAIRGMRNPLESWMLSDSAYLGDSYDRTEFVVGDKDLTLMRRLRNAGTDHRKFMRMLTVYVDINAPLYWWKEFDTYKVGTVANSCSTMHCIHKHPFSLNDFSFEHIGDVPNCDPMYYSALESIISVLNEARHCYLDTKDKAYWWQMIQLLPSSYNQTRTVMLNYEVLSNIYHARQNHKLDEWREFCEWIEELPHSELITGRDL